jgi:DNA modification methylase
MDTHTDELFIFDKPSKGQVDIHIGDCLAFLDTKIAEGFLFDAIVTDPPYEIGLHGKSWDSTGVAFSQELWTRLYKVLKPGGYVVAFAASRLYHEIAHAAQKADFRVMPMLTWEFPGGLPKPVNVAELFDRDNITDRQPIGYRKGSGFTTSNGTQGAQQRLTTKFPIYERGVSQESKDWTGYYYGNNCFKPAIEPILLAQKEPSEKRMIDNIRKHGVGALNLEAIKHYRNTDEWPNTIFRHSKARLKEHGSDHPSVKPVPLMEELCLLACPAGGHLLDPFAGTGTTGVAAMGHGFRTTLIEQNPAMEAVIRKRLT